MVFGFGAISTLIASWGEMGLMLDTVPLLMPISDDPTPTMILMAVLIAPFVEELAKPIGLYFLQHEERPRLELREWAFLGAMAGFGFALIENILYASSVAAYGNEAAFGLLFLRFLLPLHMMASAIAGYGYGLWAKTGKSKYFIYCMAAAMVIHGLFNLAATVVG